MKTWVLSPSSDKLESSIKISVILCSASSYLEYNLNYDELSQTIIDELSILSLQQMNHVALFYLEFKHRVFIIAKHCEANRLIYLGVLAYVKITFSITYY